MNTDEITVTRLLSAAQEHHIILIPARDELHIIARANVPTELIDTLRQFEQELLVALRGTTQARRI